MKKITLVFVLLLYCLTANSPKLIKKTKEKKFDFKNEKQILYTSNVNTLKSDDELVADKIKVVTSEEYESFMSLTSKQLKGLINLKY